MKATQTELRLKEGAAFQSTLFRNTEGHVTPNQFKLSVLSQNINICCLFPRTFVLKPLPKHSSAREANAPLGARSRFLHGGVEEGVAEEIQGAAEDDAGVVPRLQPRDQQRVLPHRVRVLRSNEVEQGLAHLGMHQEEFAVRWDSLAVVAPAAVKE